MLARAAPDHKHAISPQKHLFEVGCASMSRCIAHVLTSLHIGGGERVALQLAKRQVLDGERVSVVSFEEPPDGPLAAEFQEAGVRVLRVPKRRGFDVTLPPRLLARFRALGCDVVHTHNPLPLIYAAGAGKLAGARVVHTKHGPHPDRPHRLWLRRIGAACTSAFVAVSEDSGQFARSIREVSERKLTIILNGTDTEHFHPDAQARREVRAELGVDESAWLVGTVGRMAEVKNHPLLIRALAPVLSPGLQLLIAGGGEEEARTKALVRELGVGDFVHLTGPTREVARLLAALDTFALSSKTEGLPLVIPEAMSTELPIVATSVGGVPKVVDDGETGFLVPAGDEDALREQLLALQRDPDLAKRMGRRAREVACERYSVRRVADQYDALYRS